MKLVHVYFIVLLNCMYPESKEAKDLSCELSEKYGVPVLADYTEAVGKVDGVMITVTGADVTPDLKYAKIYYSALSGDGKEIANLRVESIGGGDIRIPGKRDAESEEVYIEHSFAEIADSCKLRYI